MPIQPTIITSGNKHIIAKKLFISFENCNYTFSSSLSRSTDHFKSVLKLISTSFSTVKNFISIELTHTNQLICRYNLVLCFIPLTLFCSTNRLNEENWVDNRIRHTCAIDKMNWNHIHSLYVRIKSWEKNYSASWNVFLIILRYRDNASIVVYGMGRETKWKVKKSSLILIA